MLSNRQLFLRHMAQTSAAPLMLEIVKAEGVSLFDSSGKIYMDLISGISVSNVGHRHPAVITAIEEQLKKYLHLMVYGEYIQSPQVQYASLITAHLPEKLNSVYFTNSGTEATEGAMKLAKRVTGRSEFLSFHHAYHGHTQGALSIMGDEYWKNAYRPLLPGCELIHYNDPGSLAKITTSTAAIIIEPVQAEAGIRVPDAVFLQQVRERCNETGTLLVLDEIQTGMGRTGTLFCFEQFGIVPDILLLAKAFGGGMPLGAFISSGEIMHSLSHDPALGHLTTFGGHPVSCVAGKAAMETVLNEGLMPMVAAKQQILRERLQHDAVKAFRSMGLLIALEFENPAHCHKVVASCVNAGIVTDWFLFAPHCMRIAPPLTITIDEINRACDLILGVLNEVQNG